MAALEATIQRKMKDYPMLYHNRVDALHGLFMVLGNGYDWYEGELVDDFPEDVERPAMGDHDDHLKLTRDYRLTPAQFHQVNGMALARYALPYPFSWYDSICGWTPIVEMPEDAKEDWQRGAVEIALYILANPEFSDDDVSRFGLIRLCLAITAKFWHITETMLSK